MDNQSRGMPEAGRGVGQAARAFRKGAPRGRMGPGKDPRAADRVSRRVAGDL